MTASNTHLPQPFHRTTHGVIYEANCLAVLDSLPPASADLVMTSPPYGLLRKKDYGNVEARDYLAWFAPYGRAIHRVLKPTGSFVLDIGGAWNAGEPTRSLYHFKLLIMLCDEIGFHLAQDFFWWNPARLPTPAEWVTVRRIRVKDAIDTIWWLSKTPWPRASNRRVLQPYSSSMCELLQRGYKAKKRPSGHDISSKFTINNGAAIPPNLLAIPNTESNSTYLRYCKARHVKPHPARFPAELPEYFIRMLTDAGDLVIDPFAGSCVTGEVCERLRRRWICAEIEHDYLIGAAGRFSAEYPSRVSPSRPHNKDSDFYKIPHPGILWPAASTEPLPADGGRSRTVSAGSPPPPPARTSYNIDLLPGLACDKPRAASPRKQSLYSPGRRKNAL